MHRPEDKMAWKCLGDGCPGCSACDTMKPFPVSVSLKPADLRRQAYERICAIAARKGWDERTTQNMVRDAAGYPRKVNTIDEMTLKHLTKALRALEEAFA